MRRPVDTTPSQTTTTTANDDEYCNSSDCDQKNTVAIFKTKKDKRIPESRFAKVKRILSGTLSLGRSQQDTVEKSTTSTTTVESKMKSARKRDRSQEKHNQNESKQISDNNTSPQIGLKLTKLVEYELNKNRETSPINIRKRKEHHEILSPSDDQERKLIRSNSEERPLHNIVNKELNHVKDIRRVSSHEDFKKKTLIQVEKDVENSSPKHETTVHEIKVDYQDNIPLQDRRHSPNKISPNRDPKNRFFNEHKFLSDFETEHEKRRTSERFSRPLAPRGRSKIITGVKKRKTSKDQKHNKTKNDSDNTGNDGEILDNDSIQSSPKINNSESEFPLDLNTLHEQIDSSEPICSNYLFIEEENSSSSQQLPPSITSCPRLLSPRNSLIMSQKVYLEPFIPMQSKKSIDSNTPINPVEARIRQIQKQINSLKKKLKKLDENNGTAELDNKVWMDKKVRGYMQDLNKLKKELKCLKNNTSIISINHRRNDMQNCYEVTVTTTDEDANPRKRVDMLKETLVDVQKRLSEKRQHANRSDEINDMNDEQLIDEKIAVQKALLHLESIHGRPVSKEDRDVVRPLYDRYRVLKRIVARTTNAKLNNSITELGTILEHETMNFVSTPIHENDKDVEDDNDDDDNNTPSNTPAGSMDSSDTDTSSINENLHALSLEELLDQQRLTREEKKQTRRSLKEYEHEFELKTGRKLQKDDRSSMESTYFIYKQLKGKLKLIEILIEKKRQNK